MREARTKHRSEETLVWLQCRARVCVASVHDENLLSHRSARRYVNDPGADDVLGGQLMSHCFESWDTKGFPDVF